MEGSGGAAICAALQRQDLLPAFLQTLVLLLAGVSSHCSGHIVEHCCYRTKPSLCCERLPHCQDDAQVRCCKDLQSAHSFNECSLAMRFQLVAGFLMSCCRFTELQGDTTARSALNCMGVGWRIDLGEGTGGECQEKKAICASLKPFPG